MNILKSGLSYLKDLVGYDTKPVNTKVTMTSTPAMIVPKTKQSMTFSVGAGMSNVTTVLPGPRVSTLETIKRGDTIKVVPVGQPTKISDVAKAKAVVGKVPEVPIVSKIDRVKNVGGVIKAVTKDQYQKTKESLPYLPATTKETFTTPKNYSDFNVGMMGSLGKGILSTADIINKATGYVSGQKRVSQAISAKIKTAKDYLTPPTPTLATKGGELTGEFQKFALMDASLKAALAPLAKTKMTVKKEVVQHYFEDAAQKAELSGLADTAAKLRVLKSAPPADLGSQIKAITKISEGVNNIEFKRGLLGTISQMATDSSTWKMAQIAKEPAVAKAYYNVIKELPRAAKMAANIGSFIAIGQIDHEEGQGSRAEQALKDLAIGAAFEGVGVAYKALSPIARRTYEEFKAGTKIKLEDAENLAKELKANQAGFAKLPGEESSEIGITSFRGTPVKTVKETEKYYSTPEAKKFEESLINEAPNNNLKVNDIKKTAGFWEGNIEPSFQVNVKGKMSDKLSYAAKHGEKANQDAVILFTPKKGNGTKYTINSVENPDAVLKELKNSGISGATIVNKDIVIFDIDNSLESAIMKLIKDKKYEYKSIKGEVKLIERNEYGQYTGGGIGNRNNISSQLQAEEVTSSFNLDRLKLNDQQRTVLQDIINANATELNAAKGDTLKLNEVFKRAEKESEVLQSIITREETAQQAAKEVATRNEITRLAKIVEYQTTDTAAKEIATKRMIELLKADAADAADVARRLGSRRVVAEDVGIAEAMTKRLLALGNKAEDVTKEAAKVNWKDDNSVVDFYRKFVKPTTFDILTEMRYNNMLSNPRTFARNFTSNLAQTLITRPLVKAIEAGIDTFIAPLTGKEREYFLKNVPKYYYGLIKSIPKAFEEFGKVWKGTEGITQQDLQRIPTGKIPKIWRIPSLALEGTDVMMRELIAGGEMAGGMAEKEARKIAEYSLFRSGLDATNKTGQGKILSYIDKVISKIDGLREIEPVRWFVPFLRTPMNFAKMWIEYSPAGALTMIGSSRKKEQFAKMMIGSAITAYGANLAWQDKTTWSTPTDPEARDAFYAAGKKPFSVLIGNKWVPMMYLGPWALALAVPSGVKYYQEESPTALTDSQTKKIERMAMSMAEYFSQQTFMEGLGNFVNLFKGSPDVSLEKNLAFTAGQIIPLQGLLRYTSTVVDPVFRKSNGFVESLQSGIPFLSEELQAYTDPSGVQSTRNWTDYLAPYSAGKKQGQFDEIFNIREKELQSNAVFNELNKEDKKKALQVIEGMYNAKTDDEVIKAVEPLRGDAGLKKVVKSMIKKQADYQAAKLEPYKILDTTARAEYVYTALMLANTKGGDKETEFIELIKELKEANLFGSKERKAFKALLKEYPLE